MGIEKRLEFKQHALKRMKERGISRIDVEAALKNREIVAPYGSGGSRIYSSACSKPIIVGIREFDKKIVVITAMNWEREKRDA
ncbi:MAG: DUF4258 domain-containing protein [Planctomycetes bacterium]|nr:DUF4258 domain-containing protein [Planctomycetota bacterium]